ncbi:MAG: hypothetical protein MK078_15380 [Crocinitomicaceae bacterium]|nr:hypothetical protein [Crocinitomicaceae bacterium]
MMIFVVRIIILTWRKRDRKNYSKDLEKFKIAIDNYDLEQINKYGRKLVWNQYLLDSDKSFIYDEVEKIKDLPRMSKLWNDIHYKKHGLEPF